MFIRSPEKISQALSYKMANMAVVSSFLIVAMHGFSMATVPALGSSMWWFYKLFRETIVEIAVPYFFCVSAFLLAGHCAESGWYGREVRKRVRTIMVPFFLWILIAIPVKQLGFVLMNLLTGRSALQGVEFHIIDLIATFGFTLDPPDPTILWFLRSLFFFVVSSPLIVVAIMKLDFVVPSALLLINLMYCPSPPLQKLWGFFFSLSGLFWFTMGIWMRLSPKITWCSLCGKKVVMSSWGTLSVMMILKVSFLQMGKSVPTMFDKMMILIALLAFWSVIPSIKLPRWLTSASFPVYLLHPFLFYFIYGLMSIWNCQRLVVENFGCYLLVISFVFFMGVLIAYGIRRFLPGFSTVLFGGRT